MTSLQAFCQDATLVAITVGAWSLALILLGLALLTALRVCEEWRIGR